MGSIAFVLVVGGLGFLGFVLWRELHGLNERLDRLWGPRQLPELPQTAYQQPWPERPQQQFVPQQPPPDGFWQQPS